jgi:hypothetical protein
LIADDSDFVALRVHFIDNLDRFLLVLFNIFQSLYHGTRSSSQAAASKPQRGR